MAECGFFTHRAKHLCDALKSLPGEAFETASEDRIANLACCLRLEFALLLIESFPVFFKLLQCRDCASVARHDDVLSSPSKCLHLHAYALSEGV